MMKKGLSKAFVLPALMVWSCDNETQQEVFSNMQVALAPPCAPKNPQVLNMHGHNRMDEYFWLSERENPEVIKYLETENAYLQRVMTPLTAFKALLYQEMKQRIKEDDASVPYQLDDYFYYSRYESGSEYPLYCRRKGSMEAAEEVLVNGNLLTKKNAFLEFHTTPSPDHRLLAIKADTVGRRFYEISFKDLESGQLLPDVIKASTGNLVWANDNKTVFYSRQHPQTLRAHQVYRHELGTPAEQDQLVFEEKDEAFSCSLRKSRSKKYIIISSCSTISSEARVLDADAPQAGFRLLQPREKNHLYFADHWGDAFYIRTNLEASNFKLVKTPVDSPESVYWQDVIAHRPDVLLESFEIFKDYLVMGERCEGHTQIRIVRWEDKQAHCISFKEAAYTACLSYNPDYNTPLLRFTYESLTTPASVYEYHMGSREKKLLKREAVLGGFCAKDYKAERLMIQATDGQDVPLSVIYHKDTPLDGTAPCLIYAYGSYGDSMDAEFSSTRLSLLNRGFVYAIAHVRGGQEMGRQWYEEGKLLKKKSTFTDFIACSEALISMGYSAADKLFAMGGSAGGLLMGAVCNMRPDLYKGIVSQVPFVDVVTTMLDASIPLTTGEYDEWGNPHTKAYYDYMLSYSPYDNIEAKDYPHMLVTTGLQDSQVQYWEPAKYVARLREKKTDDNLLLLYTNMTAGHGGASGRFEALQEAAMEFAFLLDLAGKAPQQEIEEAESNVMALQ